MRPANKKSLRNLPRCPSAIVFLEQAPNPEKVGIMSTDDIQSEADAWLIEVIGVESEDLPTVLLGLEKWLQAAPAHAAAFRRSARTWRLAGPLLRAAEPGAGRRELDALFEALKKEQAHTPKR